MKTVSILRYDRDGHQFYPSFVIQDDLEDNDNECSFDELVISPSGEWMDEYLRWNRFGRLPEDPAEDNLLNLDEDDPTTSIPVFETLQELHEFNAKGAELTRRLQVELKEGNHNKCAIRVAAFRPLYTNMVVGPVAAWWHLKDHNYGFVVPVQRMPVSDQLKSRLQAFRCHKGMGLWQDPTSLNQLIEEGRELQQDLLVELAGGPPVEENRKRQGAKPEIPPAISSCDDQEEERGSTAPEPLLEEYTSCFGPPLLREALAA